ncbi:sensor domain-containing diguanylate cyclase [Methylobacterium sp. GC_Met_2]|uniref:GGDEF domain-containing protein n=1 Tax=Methylobacterium sp. GC_Met_2 TaxID=2937376 RepID=UPI00226B8714
MLTLLRPRRSSIPALSSRGVAALNWITVAGLAGVSGLMLWTMHDDAAERADAASHALVQVLSRDIARNIELLDLSLQAVVDGLQIPAVRDAEPAVRRMILFDRASTARNFGALIVTDEHGTTVLSSRDSDPPKLNIADREYFQHHRDHADDTLHVGAPFVGRIRGKWVLPISRRLSHADGSFAGVVRAVIELDYFRNLFEAATTRHVGRLELYGPGGTVLMSAPYDPTRIDAHVAGNPSYEHMALQGEGTFHGPAVVGTGEHNFVYAHVGSLPLVLSTCMKSGAAFATWWWRALTLGGVVAILLAAVLGLTRRLQRELAQHKATELRLAAANAELAALATTDALTGLGNRRLFDEALDGEWRRAVRSQRPLSLLILDADWFKGFNDLYGHQHGDEALRLIARSLDAVLNDRFDTGFRIGGEEFAVLLPDTDLAGAVVVAERIRVAVAGWALSHAGSPHGVLSVSCGAAEMIRARASDPAALVAASDIALYEAKQLGRDRVWSVDLAVAGLRSLSGVSEPTSDRQRA